MTRSRIFGENQTPFGKWLQENERLPSGPPDYIVVSDVDFIIHRYNDCWDMIDGQRRLINHLMIIEAKTRMGEPSFSQTATYTLLNKMLFRKKYGKHRCETYLEEDVKGRKIVCKWWGIHLLQFSNTNPSDSETIKWDRRQITVYDLEDLLRFRLNPLTLTKIISDKRHHKMVDGKWIS